MKRLKHLILVWVLVFGWNGFVYASESQTSEDVEMAEEINPEVVLDAAHASNGYFTIYYTGESERVRVRVTKENDSYIYDLHGMSGTFSFSQGNGSYIIELFEHQTGDYYMRVFSQTMEVTLINDTAPFLHPNQHVNYSGESDAVKVGQELTNGLACDIDKVEAVYHYIITNIRYDHEKAKTVPCRYIPKIDQVLKDKKGICFDYASLMAAMLRSQGIPAQLVMGYANNGYHAWVQVYLKDRGWVIYDPTFAATGHPELVRQYTQYKSNYQIVYVY